MLRRLGISSVLPKELLLWVVNTTSLNHPEFKANACRAALVRLVLTFWIANLTLQVTSVSVSITPCILFHSEKRTLLGLVELQQAFPVGPLPSQGSKHKPSRDAFVLRSLRVSVHIHLHNASIQSLSV